MARLDNITNKRVDMDKTSTRTLTGILLLALFAVTAAVVGLMSTSAHAAQATVNLGAASPFAILSGTPNITDAGNASTITGDVGLAPATGAGIGLICGQVNGTIYSVDATGPLPCRVTNGPLLVTAKNNLTAAYTDAANRTPLTTVNSELAGQTLVAGVYDSANTQFGITGGGPALILDGQNDPSSVFIFQAPFNGNGLTVGNGSVVSLVNGAQACNVFWRVNTASIGTTATFVGTILALNSITANNGATIDGRLLARNGSVTLNTNTITNSVCAGNDSEDNDEGTGVVVPGFPNTGRMIADNLLWVAVPAFVIIAAVAGAFVARKKHLI